MKSKRYRLKKEQSKVQRHIQNLMRDAHTKMCLEWTEKYDAILIPRFRVSEMMKKNNNGKKRILNSETARKMMNWRHFAFRKRLFEIAEVNGCEVYEVTEYYTSKTCSNCGCIHWKLGGNHTFRCPNANCKMEMERDMNAAKGIFMMNLEHCGFELC